MASNDVPMCPGQPIPVGDTVPVCGHFAAHHPHALGQSITYRSQETDQQPFSPLVGAIFTQMAADSAATTNALIASYEAQNNALRAELAAIKTGISDLLSHDWMPTSDAIRRAVFFPDIAEVDW